MEKVSDLLFKIYYVYKTEPIKFLGFLLLSVGVYLIYDQTERILDYLPKVNNSNVHFETALKRDALVLKTLESVVVYLDAEAAVIGQYHNGEYDLTNLPFTKVSITYAFGAQGLSTDLMYTTRPLSSMGKISQTMWHSQDTPMCVGRYVSNLKDTAYRNRMMETKMNWIIICPISNILGYPIGYMSAGWYEEPEDKDAALRYLKIQSDRIAGYLQGAT